MKLDAKARTIRDTIKTLVRPTKQISIVLDAIARAAQRGEMPYAAYNAAYGIAWSLDTGRLDGRRHIALKGLKFPALVNLVATITALDLTIGDVPRWLLANFDPH